MEMKMKIGDWLKVEDHSMCHGLPRMQPWQIENIFSGSYVVSHKGRKVLLDDSCTKPAERLPILLTPNHPTI